MSDSDNEDQESTTTTWQELKEIGNTHFKSQNYDQSVSFYTQALERIDQASAANAKDVAILYSNRSMCRSKLCQYTGAEADARKAYEADASFVKSLNRLGVALCGRGRFGEAVTEFQRGIDLAKSRKDATALDELSVLLREAQQAADAVDIANKYLLQQSNNNSNSGGGGGASNGSPTSPSEPSSPSSSSSPSGGVGEMNLSTIAKKVADAYLTYSECFDLACLFAEIQAAVDPERAASVLSRVSHPTSPLRKQAEDSAAFAYVRALVAFYGNASTGTAAAKELLRTAMELDPDNVKYQRLFKKVRNIETKKAAGNDAYKNRQWKQAVDFYTEAINIDGANKRLAGLLLGNRAAAKIELNDSHGALSDVSAAIDRGNDAAKIYARRSKIYEKLGKWDDAKRDLQKAAELEEDKYGRGEMKEFDERRRVANRKNYYDILGVAKTIPADQLKSAYRKEAFKWHPDKWAHATDSEKEFAESKFKDVQEAHSLLSDPQKRRLYDSGQMDTESEGVRGPQGFGGGGGGGGGMHGVDLAEMMGMFGGMGGGRRAGGMGGRGGGGMPGGMQFNFGF